MTATRNDQKSLKSGLAEQGPSTHDSTRDGGLLEEELSDDPQSSGGMEPPWRRYPALGPRDRAWALRGGEHANYMSQFMIWYAGLSDEQSASFRANNEEPISWAEYYEYLESERILAQSPQ